MTTYRDMSTNVRRYLWLILASLTVSIASVPWQPQDSKLQAILSYAGYAIFIAMGELLIFLILAPFMWAAAWRRQNWARWVLLIAFLAALPFMFDVPAGYYTLHPFATACTSVSLAIEGVALYFLFSGDAQPWFRKQKFPPVPPDA